MGYELIKVARFVKAPPHPSGEVLHLSWRHIVEPFPCKRALAHAAHSDHAHNAH